MVPLEFIDEISLNPTLSEGFIAATSKKPNTKVYITVGRRCGKSMYQYECIKAMLEAGYEFVPVEELGYCTTFLVKPGKKMEDD